MSATKSDWLRQRSPEVQEVINRTPNSLIKWGISVIFITILSILLLSWFVKYPDLILAKVTITTNPPPISLVSRIGGTLHLNRTEAAEVQKGEIVAYINSNTSVEALLDIESHLEDMTDFLNIKFSGSLGDIQPYFASLVSDLTSLHAIDKNKVYDNQIKQLERQVSTYRKLEKSLVGYQSIVNQELKLTRQKFATDSVLFEQKVTSDVDFKQARMVLFQKQRDSRNSEVSILNNEAQINLFNKQMADLKMQKAEQIEKVNLSVRQAKDQLIAQIKKWKESYLFIATCSGKLAYNELVENEQFIEANKPLFSVIPNKASLIAHAELPIHGSGKVKIGQNVNIRLENYPYEEFGFLRGEISSISLVPGNEKYWVKIELPHDLVTNRNNRLTFKQNLSGSTEIITEDLRLFDRLLFQFRRATTHLAK